MILPSVLSEASSLVAEREEESDGRNKREETEGNNSKGVIQKMI